MVRNNIDTGITSLPGKKSFSDQDYHRSHVDGRSYADVTREGRGREPTQVFYQRRTRGRGYSNWDREQVRSRQRRDRYEPRKEETRRRFYDGANRYDRAAKQNGGNDRYRHGGQQPNNVVNRNRNRYGKPRGGPRQNQQDEIQNNIQILIQLPGSEWAQNFDIASGGPAATLVADSRGRLCVRYGLNWYKGWLVHHLQGLRMEEMMPFNLPHRVTQRERPHSTANKHWMYRSPRGPTWSREEIGHQIYNIPLLPVSPHLGGHHLHCRHQGSSVQHEGPDSRLGYYAVPEYPVSAPSRRDEPMRRPPTSDEDTDGEQQSGPFVPELSTSTPPRRDEPLMELTSDEEDQDGEQQPEPLVLPVTKDDYHRSHVDGRSYADVTREGRGREPTQVFYQRRTRGRGYSNWDREQVRSRQRRDRYEPRKEETRRRFYDGANRYDRAAKQNGGNDRYRHGGQQPNNVVNRNRNSSHFGRRLKRETLREVRAQLVQRLAGAPSSRPADGGDDAIQPATQSDPERTTAQHSQQTLDVPVRTPASVSIPAMAQSRLIVTAEIHPPPRGQRSPEILMTPTPSAVPGQVTAGTNMEQGGDWSPDIQHSSPPGFPSPGRSSPTLQTPREQRPARGPDSRLGYYSCS
ncbi:hypothetical protein DPEC_G00362040 [Dallia pectoralis]|nr:hypothetical protein DPEC_G00362040 [Dallia pectoralis]